MTSQLVNFRAFFRPPPLPPDPKSEKNPVNQLIKRFWPNDESHQRIYMYEARRECPRSVPSENIESFDEAISLNCAPSIKIV